MISIDQEFITFLTMQRTDRSHEERMSLGTRDVMHIELKK